MASNQAIANDVLILDEQLQVKGDSERSRNPDPL
jgi:hypothetical protein